MTATDQTIDTCNSLLRGELAAIETYTQALEKFGDAQEDDFLERIRTDHEDNAQELRDFIAQAGGEAADSSGAWGGFAQAIEGGAALLGESPALKILLEGEEHGIKEYRDALEDAEVSADLKDLIRSDLLPPLRDHIVELQRRRNRLA